MIAAAHPGWSMGATVAGSRGDGFTGERFQKVAGCTAAVAAEDHPVPLHRTLLHVHDLGQSKSTLRQAGSMTMLWAVSAINCRPKAATAEAVQPAVLEQLTSTVHGRLAQVPP